MNRACLPVSLRRIAPARRGEEPPRLGFTVLLVEERRDDLLALVELEQGFRGLEDPRAALVRVPGGEEAEAELDPRPRGLRLPRGDHAQDRGATQRLLALVEGPRDRARTR
jgi:hypothetical protein